MLKEEKEDHFVLRDIESLFIKGTTYIEYYLMVDNVDRDIFSDVGVLDEYH